MKIKAHINRTKYLIYKTWTSFIITSESFKKHIKKCTIINIKACFYKNQLNYSYIYLMINRVV